MLQVNVGRGYHNIRSNIMKNRHLFWDWNSNFLQIKLSFNSVIKLLGFY